MYNIFQCLDEQKQIMATDMSWREHVLGPYCCTARPFVITFTVSFYPHPKPRDKESVKIIGIPRASDNKTSVLCDVLPIFAC